MMMATAYAVSIVLGRSMNGTVYPLTLGVGAFGIVVAADGLDPGAAPRRGARAAAPRGQPA